MKNNNWQEEYIKRANEDKCFLCDGCKNSNEMACDNSDEFFEKAIGKRHPDD